MALFLFKPYVTVGTSKGMMMMMMTAMFSCYRLITFGVHSWWLLLHLHYTTGNKKSVGLCHCSRCVQPYFVTKS